MGHIFSYTQTDFIARFQRMSGKTVFYPMGFDDNGLPTERLVEKAKGIKASHMVRSEFISLCQEVVNEAEKEYHALFRSIALSVDWKQTYQTISPHTRKISQMSFLDLYEKNLVTRQYGPTFWDPVDRTALAQADIVDKEQQGIMSEIAFQLEDGNSVYIATTRPELLGSCVALFFHPEDGRYKHLIGQKAITPIFNKQVPILEDEAVDIAKGTGIVMCCTFGDIQDIVWWRRYKLETIHCISLEGRMCNSSILDGMKVKDAKVKILEILKEQGLVGQQKDVQQFVKCAERSGAPLEIIPTSQWYIDVLSKKEAILEKVNECLWHPSYMKVRLENWVNGLNQDWCISRQRYFGVPFPVWYSKRKGEEGKVLLPSIDQLPVDPITDLPKGYNKDEVDPDFDVMDTWATSSLTPQITSYAINDKYAVNLEKHSKLFPFDLRPQAHEIIRSWAFATIVKSLYHQDTIPWKHLMISGWCLASDKTKMSKSKGNVVTPEALIHEKGTDVVRYWAANSKLGVDIAYSEDILKIGHKLLNKLWNASKFVYSHLQHLPEKICSLNEAIERGFVFETLDLWILLRLKKVIKSTTKSFKEFKYCDARHSVEDFFWNDFCDNYLELIKVRVYNSSHDAFNTINYRDDVTVSGAVLQDEFKKGQISACYTLYYVLYDLLKLFAPILPHITEELYSVIFKENSSIHKRGSWPDESLYIISDELLKQGQCVLNILELVRKFKSEKQISLRATIEKLFCYGIEVDRSSIRDLKSAACAKEIVQETAVREKADVVSECGKYSICAIISKD